MGFLNLFKKRKSLSIEELKWNKMWDLWAKDEIESPYLELMTYYNEINGGGHFQFFDNASNSFNLKKLVSLLCDNLSYKLNKNLSKAYEVYLKHEKDSSGLEDFLEEFDNVYYENEDEIDIILKEYAKTLQL